MNDEPPPLDQASDAHTRALRAWLAARGDAEPPARATLAIARNNLRRAELLELLQRHPHVERPAWFSRRQNTRRRDLRTGYFLRQSQR